MGEGPLSTSTRSRSKVLKSRWRAEAAVTGISSKNWLTKGWVPRMSKVAPKTSLDKPRMDTSLALGPRVEKSMPAARRARSPKSMMPACSISRWPKARMLWPMSWALSSLRRAVTMISSKGPASSCARLLPGAPSSSGKAPRTATCAATIPACFMNPLLNAALRMNGNAPALRWQPIRKLDALAGQTLKPPRAIAGTTLARCALQRTPTIS